MRYSLLSFIQCVFCGGELDFLSTQEEIHRQDDSIEIKEGLLKCDKCGHWFPLRDFIPELLPDHLRNWPEDLAFLNNLKAKTPGHQPRGKLSIQKEQTTSFRLSR